MSRWRAFAVCLTLLGGTPSAGADSWMPVREINLEIASGSPLDFSTLLPNRPINPESAIGANRRVIAGRDGHLVFADRQDQPTRMLCASLAWSPASGDFPPHAQADRYARQLAMRGYNIARLHFMDASLMAGRQQDFDFDPDTLDRVHYLLAALKRNGIYWSIDAMSSWRGAYGGYDDRWDPSSNFKTALHVDKTAFDHWRRFQEAFLKRVNPYTSIAPIDDDALALIVLTNENGLEFSGVARDRPGRPSYDPILRKPFNRWLRKQYPSTAALAEAWGDLTRHESLEDGTIALPQNRYEDSARIRDLQAFFVAVENDSTARMTKAIRDLGYRGLISTYNNWPTVQTALSRRQLDAVTMNTYHDWVSGYHPGAKTTQVSSLANSVDYIRMAAGSRWLGKPFILTEWDHLFWNRHRYEAGLAMPAYAALQGWDMLCRHGHGPIVLRYGEPYAHKRAMLPYAIALDPVARAAETLAALIYRRGDVEISRISIPFAMRGLEDLNNDMQAREPDALTRLSLVARIGLADEGMARRQARFVPQPRAPDDGQRLLSALREQGVLPPSNRTSPQTGRYESDTGQILLDEAAQVLQVTTPATQGIAYANLTIPIDLGDMTVGNATGAGLVAASALEKAGALADSQRMLITFATDARNSAMRFRDRAETTIEDFGRLPVLIRKGAVDIAMAREGRWRLSPVGLDGVVHAPVAQGDGPVRFRLDNDAPSGPTTFFLLEIL